MDYSRLVCDVQELQNELENLHTPRMASNRSQNFCQCDGTAQPEQRDYIHHLRTDSSVRLVYLASRSTLDQSQERYHSFAGLHISSHPLCNIVGLAISIDAMNSNTGMSGANVLAICDCRASFEFDA